MKENIFLPPPYFYLSMGIQYFWGNRWNLLSVKAHWNQWGHFKPHFGDKLLVFKNKERWRHSCCSCGWAGCSESCKTCLFPANSAADTYHDFTRYLTGRSCVAQDVSRSPALTSRAAPLLTATWLSHKFMHRNFILSPCFWPCLRRRNHHLTRRHTEV